MGEYAEYEMARQMRRGQGLMPEQAYKDRNPITRHCPHCGKGTRSLAGDPEGGLMAHIKAKHSPKTAQR